MKKNIKQLSIYHILIISFFLRIFAMFFFSDVKLENEWAIIIHNFETSGVIGLNVVINEYLAVPKLADVGEKVLPTIFMPPLYSYFILAIKFFLSNDTNLVNIIIILQILISVLSIFIFYKIINSFGSIKKYSIAFSTIFSFFPIYIYSVTQISSITLQIFLVLCFLYLITLLREGKILILILFSFFSGLLILIRGEFFLFYLLALSYFFLILDRNYKYFLLSIFFTLIVISPYLIRNYNNYNTVTLTKSFGYNLLKGNNPSLIVEGNSEFIDKKYDRKSLKIETNYKYEIILDNFYKDEAFAYIKEDPPKYLKFYLTKIIAFLFFDKDSSYPYYFNFLHIFPKIIVSILCLIGAILALKKTGFFQFLSLYYFANIFLFSIFFILPRYSLILLPIQLLLTLIALNYLFRKFLN